MSDIDRLLEGRKIIDRYRRNIKGKHGNKENPLDITSEKEDKLKKLERLGFSSEEEFMDFDRDMCIEEARKCTVYEGECDRCEGKPMGCNPSCFESRTTGLGRPKIIPDMTKIFESAVYWRRHKRAKLGDRHLMMNGCTITEVTVKVPAFFLYWRLGWKELDWDSDELKGKKEILVDVTHSR